MARQIFAAIRAARPKKLWIHADGPRKNRPGEAEKCTAVRALFDEIDWPCEVVKLFRDENWGLKKGLADALKQFFQVEKTGIILEDDQLPDPSFFPFCEQLLEKYKADERVMHISGLNNILETTYSESASYRFTNYAIVGAWATWARAWKHFDPTLADLDKFRKSGRFDSFLPNPLSRRYLLEKFEAVRAGRLDSWAFPWFFSVAKMGGLGILPVQNLVESIGVGVVEATNTTQNFPRILPAGTMPFPLRHPENMERDPAFDQQLFYSTHKPFWKLILRQFFRLIGVIKAS